VPLLLKLTVTVTLDPGAPEPPVNDSVAWAAALVTIAAATLRIETVLLYHPHETRVVVAIYPPIQFGFTVSLCSDFGPVETRLPMVGSEELTVIAD